MNFKKIVTIGMVAMSVMAAFTGCGSSNNTSSTNEKKIIVGTNPTFVPFEFKDEKTQGYDGYDIDMINAIANKMGAKVEFKNVSFDALIPALMSKDIDIAVSGMTITPERKSKVLFATPYYESGLAIVTKSSTTTINSINDLSNHTVSVQLGTTGAKAAHAINGATIKEFDHSNEALLELKIGNVEAAVLDLPVAQYYMSKHPEENLKIIPLNNNANEYFGIAMSQDNSQLQKEINKAIADLKASGEFDKIYQKWFNQNAPTDMPVE